VPAPKAAPRLIAALWVVLGVAIWNAFFDLYVSRGAREYLQKQLEYETGRGPQPSMDEVMRRSRRDGLVMSSVWAGLVVAGGLGTLRWAALRRADAGDHRPANRT
jgi:hypothetical protein